MDHDNDLVSVEIRARVIEAARGLFYLWRHRRPPDCPSATVEAVIGEACAQVSNEPCSVEGLTDEQIRDESVRRVGGLV